MSKNKDKISTLLKELFALSKKMSFFDAKLKDGSILRTEDDALAKGSAVVLIGADGTQSDAPDGDHTTEDGSVVTIKSGVVDGIAAATPEKANEKMDEAPMPDSPVTDDSAEMADDGSEMDLATIADTIKNLIDRISALEDMCSNTTMTVEKMSAAPAAKQFNASPYGEGTIGSELEKYRAEKKAKETSSKEAMLKFAASRVKPGAQEPKMNTQNFNSNTKRNDAPINFGGSMTFGN